MTKSTELEILRDAVAKLGPDSYCGPWLQSVLLEVEHDLRCDIIPTVTLAGTILEAAETLVQAKERAEETIRNAETRANRIAGEAQIEADRVRENALAVRKRITGILHETNRQLWEV
jgi:hypothetical protein